jgi:T-complex protein 1 subunit epsilon
MRAFADALDSIPIALADNSGLPAIEVSGFSHSPLFVIGDQVNSLCFVFQSLAMAKSSQVQTNNPHIGIDCLQTGQPDMKQQRVFETLLSKVQQFQLATQVLFFLCLNSAFPFFLLFIIVVLGL